MIAARLKLIESWASLDSMFTLIVQRDKAIDVHYVYYDDLTSEETKLAKREQLLGHFLK